MNELLLNQCGYRYTNNTELLTSFVISASVIIHVYRRKNKINLHIIVKLLTFKNVFLFLCIQTVHFEILHSAIYNNLCYSISVILLFSK